MASPGKSVLIVGAGIAGLCLALVAQAGGHAVTVVARDAAEETASGIAAGMIAPALEARGGPNPHAFARLKAAQAAWLELMPVWPATVQDQLRRQQAQARSRFIAADGAVSEISGDWLIDAMAMLAALEADFVARGGTIVRSEVAAVTARTVTLQDGRELRADQVVVAAGYAAHALAGSVPSLSMLTPIKGHLLDLPGQGEQGVTRSARGYLADYGDHAKFGASMQAGADDLAIEPDVVADLKVRATTMVGVGLDDAVPRTGVRASTPDGWPMIGRDANSGVWIVAGMRRNGFVFAPFAAGVISDGMKGIERRDAAIYDPNRFA